jgi:hypothetical protein
MISTWFGFARLKNIWLINNDKTNSDMYNKFFDSSNTNLLDAI